MTIQNTGPEWDQAEDRVIWKQFLMTRTGSRLIPKLLEMVPMLLPKGELNEILIRSGEVRGWGACASYLLGLAEVEPDPVPDNSSVSYPPLDDDTQWTDGQNLGNNPQKTK